MENERRDAFDIDHTGRLFMRCDNFLEKGENMGRMSKAGENGYLEPVSFW